MLFMIDTGFEPFGIGDHEMFGAGEGSNDFPCQKMEALKKKRTELHLGYINMETTQNGSALQH